VRGDGHTVVTFSSSSDALRHLGANPADLLVTDIVMPPPDGFRLVTAARKLHPDLAAILVTGYASRYSLDDMLACGAADLIFKPFRLQELRTRIGLAEARRWRGTTVPPRLQAPGSLPDAEVDARRALYALSRKAG
jgi:DNA-binding NtrC family response regulator